MTFMELQRASDELLPWGRRYYSKGGFLAEMDDRVIGVIADSVEETPVPGLEVYCLQLGGAVADIDEDATAYSGRAGAFYWISQGVWDSPEDDERAIGWCRRTARRLGGTVDEHQLRQRTGRYRRGAAAPTARRNIAAWRNSRGAMTRRTCSA